MSLSHTDHNRLVLYILSGKSATRYRLAIEQVSLDNNMVLSVAIAFKQISAAAVRPTHRTVLYTVYDKLLTETVPVYNSDCPPKSAAPETISLSSGMTDTHKKLNGSSDITTPLTRMI